MNYEHPNWSGKAPRESIMMRDHVQYTTPEPTWLQIIGDVVMFVGSVAVIFALALLGSFLI